MIKKTILILSLCFMCFKLFSINVDSLKTTINYKNIDSTQINSILKVAQFYNNNSPDSALKYFKISYYQAKKINLIKRQATALQMIGVQFDIVNNIDSAIYYLKRAYSLSEVNKLNQLLYRIGNSLGVCHYRMGKYVTSMEFYIKSLKLAEEYKDTLLIAKINDNIGHIFYNQSKFEEAENHYNVGIELGIKTKNKSIEASGYMNLGYLQFAAENFQKGKECFLKSVAIYEKIQDLYWLSNAYQSLAIACNNLDQAVEAETYYLRSLELFEKTGQLEGIAQSYVNLGDLNFDNNNMTKAIEYYEKALKVSQKINIPEGLKFSYLGLTSSYKKIGDFENALQFHEKYLEVKDSLLNETSLNQVKELETKYESEKKQKEIELLNKEKAITDLQISSQKQFIYGVVFVLILVGVLLIVVFISLQQKRKNNKMLAKKNEEINESKKILEIKNEEITSQRDQIQVQKNELEYINNELQDSIKVAERIQKAFFSTEEKDISLLPSHFVLFKPKDVVSGDFYWSHIQKDTKNNSFLYISVADCTGHGVPGAFMSMLGLSFINELLNNFPLISPAQLLEKLSDKLVSELKQKEGTDVKEGMDMSVIKVNLSTLELEFAGANNPVYYTNNNEVCIQKGTKRGIGYQQSDLKFENISFKLEKNSMVYLFSDGFADQFGGIKGKKLGYKALRELIYKQQMNSVNEQEKAFNTFFTQWKASEEQVDDVCLIGIKF